MIFIVFIRGKKGERAKHINNIRMYKKNVTNITYIFDSNYKEKKEE